VTSLLEQFEEFIRRDESFRYITSTTADEVVERVRILVAESKAAGLEDAIGVFSKRQAEMQRQAMSSRAPPEKVADCKKDAAMCDKVIHILRAAIGQRKKGKTK